MVDTDPVSVLLRYLAGVLLLIVGLIGLILPIMPGWPFIFVGLQFLGLGFLIPAPAVRMAESMKRRLGIR